MNAHSPFPAAAEYQGLIDRMEKLSAASWEAQQNSIQDIDRKISAQLIASNQDHYAIRFNPFMAVRSDWKEDE